MPAKEGSSYNLTCSLTGLADHVYWMKNGQRLHEDNRTIFYMDTTLHFNSVGRNDSGNYMCMAINAVSNMTSHPYKLIVNCEYTIQRTHATTVNDTILMVHHLKSGKSTVFTVAETWIQLKGCTHTVHTCLVPCA